MKMRRLLSIILCLCMFVSLFSMSAMADNEPPVFVPEGFDSGEGEGVGDTDGDVNQPPLEPTDSTDPPLVPGDGENTGDTDDGNVDPNTPAPVADPPVVQPLTAPVAVASPTSFTYTGEQLCPNVSVYTDSSMATALAASEYTVSYSNNVNAGTASFTVNDIEGGEYSFSSIGGTYVINRADPAYTAPSAVPGLKFDGSKKQLVYPGSAPAGCTILYGMTEEGQYYASVPVGQQTGTYKVWWKIEASENYNAVGPYAISVSITNYTAGDKVADMIRGLSWLPDGQVDPGNEHQRSAVLSVWGAYNNLSYAEQQKVPAELYDWLYYLVACTDYAIISGSGATWYKGKSSGIGFTAIDPKNKFAGVRVDGELIDSSNYECYWYGENAYGYNDLVVVTLKPSYLTNLGFGQHSISICYWNGYAPGHFYIMEATGSPPTGDTANFPLWGSMMLISAMGLAAAAAFVFKRKKNEG